MVYALFDREGGLSRQAMRRQVQAMLAHKVHGIAVLGLASEVGRLAPAERRRLMEWVAEDIGGKVPLAVTIAEGSVDGQIEFVGAAAALGARWVILQPPPVKHVPEGELIRFFGAVADRSPLPVAIQNAPDYLGIGLSGPGLKALNRAHPNVVIAKLEATAIGIARVIDETEGAIEVFNGRGGLEITDALRAGAVGIIPGGETFDRQVALFDAFVAGTAEGAAAAPSFCRSSCCSANRWTPFSSMASGCSAIAWASAKSSLGCRSRHPPNSASPRSGATPSNSGRSEQAPSRGRFAGVMCPE
jgi:4-hydroxy-tetrahydrodipicolinate synthase